MTGEFPAQSAGDAENVFIRWPHYTQRRRRTRGVSMTTPIAAGDVKAAIVTTRMLVYTVEKDITTKRVVNA